MELRRVSGGQEPNTIEEIVVMGVRLQRSGYLSPNPEISPFGFTYAVYDGLGYQAVSAETQSLLDGNFDSLDDHNDEMVWQATDPTSWRWSDPEALRYDYQDAIRKRDTATTVGTAAVGASVFQASVEWFSANKPNVLTNDVARAMAQSVALRANVALGTALLGAGAAFEAARWNEKAGALEDRMEALGILPTGV